MMGTMRRARTPVLLVLVALVLALAAGRAPAQDRDRGLVTLRRARAALLAEDLDEARRLAEEARVDLVGYPLVAHVLGDVLARAGDWRGAIAEYEGRGMVAHPSLSAAEIADVTRRAHVQSGLVRAHGAEDELRAAGVPLDAGAVPDAQLPPTLVAPLQDGIEQYEQARASLVRGMRMGSDASLRESLAAIDERLAQLREMLEQAQQQQEESQQEPQDEPQDQDESQDPQQDSPEDDARDEQGEPSQEDPQDQPPQDGEQDGQAPEDGEPQGTPPPATPRALSPQQLAQLVERLEEQAEKARELQLRQLAAQQEEVPVEKDW